MWKKISILFLLAALWVFAEPVSLPAQTNTSVSVEIRNVTTGDGTVHTGVFGKAAFRTDTPDIEFRLEPAASIIWAELSLPAGEYVIMVYQDTNGNDDLDWKAAFLEEMGWRGYAEDSIASYFSWWKESLISGSLWSLWHLPLFFIPETFWLYATVWRPG